jgi:hypothetical protein
MKKTLLLLLLLGIVVSTGYAQLGFGISKGLIGGLNLATVSGDDAPKDVKSVSTYAAGLFLEFNFPGPFSIEANALYSIKGGKTEAGSITFTDTYTYIDVPVLLKYHLPIPAVSPSIYAGPMYSTLLSAKTKQEGGYLPGEHDIKDALAKGDLGAVVGVGLGFTALRIDARYSMGLTKLDKDGTMKMYNRVISLYVGLTL